VRAWQWRAGFFTAVGLVAAAAAFIMWSELRSATATRDVMARALERAAHIAQMRRDAQALESAIEAHVRASTPEQRAAASEVMESILQSLHRARRDSTKLDDTQPAADAASWSRFDAKSKALAARVRAMTAEPEALDDADRAAAVSELQPMLAELDALAAELARANADEAPRLLERLDRGRLSSVRWGAIALGAAVLLASLLGVVMAVLLRRQDATIQRQLTALDDRNRELDAFAGRVAHDLVNPLAPLKGHLTIASRCDSARGDAKLLEHLARAQDGVARVASLVDALLKFCRSGSRVDGPCGSLDEVVASQLLESGQVAHASGTALVRDLAPGVVVTCPAALLHTVAQNLVSNALKYTAGREGASVRVVVRSEGPHGVLEVEDNGPGISAEARPKLFQPFFRARETQSLAGHGLGLATVKRVVEAHGGSIQLDSEPMKGTKVVVRLPRPAAEAALPLATAVSGR